MLKAVPKTSSLTGSVSISSDLTSKLESVIASDSEMSGPVEMIRLTKLRMNPENGRDLWVTEETFRDILKIGQPDCLVEISECDGKPAIYIPYYADLVAILQNEGREVPFSSRLEVKFYDGIVELAHSIFHHGLIQKLEVGRPNANDEHLVNSGHRRYLGGVISLQDALPAIVNEDIGESADLNSLVRSFEENDKHNGFSLLEDLKTFIKIRAAFEEENNREARQVDLCRLTSIKKERMTFWWVLMDANLKSDEWRWIANFESRDVRSFAEIFKLNGECRANAVRYASEHGLREAREYAIQRRKAQNVEEAPSSKEPDPEKVAQGNSDTSDKGQSPVVTQKAAPIPVTSDRPVASYSVSEELSSEERSSALAMVRGKFLDNARAINLYLQSAGVNVLEVDKIDNVSDAQKVLEVACRVLEESVDATA